MDIDIVVPAYNCAAWLDALFDSILGQNSGSWRILARDDASSDNTQAVLSKWEHRLGPQLRISSDSGASNLGMIGNYDAVLSQTAAPWVMLADPDDVWLPGKIEATSDAMRAAEVKVGEDTPILVCSDARVVGDDLGTVAPSYWKWSRHNPALLESFHRTIVESPALTSTIMVNRALLKLALPMTGASCPDWWLALVASAFGQVVRLPQSTILYRRHCANDSVAPMTTSLFTAVGRVDEARGRVRQMIGQYTSQAGAFLSRFEGRMAPDDVAALRAATTLLSMNHLNRRWSILRHDLWFGSPLKNAGLMLLL